VRSLFRVRLLLAGDTGGAIIGRHLDVLPPGFARPAKLHC
jgi:3D (Asp-Asp-Asp) domain-containing protein